MGSIVFEDNKILFVDNKIAFDCDCECDVITCGSCDTGETPTELALTITGLANADCGSCVDLNGVPIILTKILEGDFPCHGGGGHPGGSCDWFTVTSECGLTLHAYLVPAEGVNTFFVDLWDSDCDVGIGWESGTEIHDDCLNWSISCAFVGQTNADCDGSLSSVLVEAH